MIINKIGISPVFKGALTLSDLLSSEGTMTFVFFNDNSNGVIFEIDTDIFKFILLKDGNSLVFQRNDSACIISLKELSKTVIEHTVFINWSHSELSILLMNKHRKLESKVQTRLTIPPNDLLNYAKKENLRPRSYFDNEENFRNKVHSCLLTINEKIYKTNSYKSFWDIQYDGNKIINRKPKIEIDIQPIINALLYDQMFQNGIEVIHEYKTGAGSLDFIFIGYIKGNGLSKICSEFKLAHSDDLEKGLIQQLPDYMISSGSNYGIYCVLNFKCTWFDKPVFDNDMQLDINLAKMKTKITKVIPDNIRTFIFELGKINTASK